MKTTPEPRVTYQGQHYYLQSTGRYYQSGNQNDEERLLHRRVWCDHHGPIPDGMVVHHVNEDWADNRIENLQLMDRGEHQSQHLKERLADPVQYARNLTYLARAQEAAKEWHASAAGREWHAQHGKKSWVGRQTVQKSCVVCATTFDTFFPTRARFCSRPCEQKARLPSYKTASGVCVMCGAPYLHNRYRKQQTCSRTCGSRLRWRDHA